MSEWAVSVGLTQTHIRWWAYVAVSSVMQVEGVDAQHLCKCPSSSDVLLGAIPVYWRLQRRYGLAFERFSSDQAFLASG